MASSSELEEDPGVTKQKQGRREMRDRLMATRRAWGLFLLVTGAAWIARFLFLLRQADHGNLISVLFRGDTPPYVSMAASFVDGRWHQGGIPFHPPGFSYLLSLWLRLGGFDAAGGPPSGFPLRVGMTVIGALTCGLLFLLWRRTFSRGVALASLPFALFSFGHYVQATALNSEAFYLLQVAALLLGFVLLLERLKREETRRAAGANGCLAALLGCLAGWAVLTRAEFILTAALLITGLLIFRRRRSLVPAGIFLAALLATLTPWTVHCYRSITSVNAAHADRLPRPLPPLVLVTGYGPLNFATANNDHALGAFDTRLIDQLIPDRRDRYIDVADPSINRLYIDGYHIGLRWMAQNPGAALRLIGRKLDLASDALALGYLQADLPGGLIGERRPVDQFIPQVRWLLWIHAILILLGIVRLARTRWKAPAVLLTLIPHTVTTLAVIVAFFGYARLCLLLSPVLWALQGAGALFLIERLPWPRSWQRHAGRLVALLIALLLVVELLGVFQGPQRYGVSGPRLPGTEQVNPDELLQIHPR